jgi:hypothetical protein
VPIESGWTAALGRLEQTKEPEMPIVTISRKERACLRRLPGLFERVKELERTNVKDES